MNFTKLRFVKGSKLESVQLHDNALYVNAVTNIFLKESAHTETGIACLPPLCATINAKENKN